MLKIASWLLRQPVLTPVAHLLPKYNRQIDPVELEKTIATTLPAGTSKDHVIEFLSRSPALFRKNEHAKIKTRFLGEARDGVHSWEIDVTFCFDAEQRLRSYSMNECFTFY